MVWHKGQVALRLKGHQNISQVWNERSEPGKKAGILCNDLYSYLLALIPLMHEISKMSSWVELKPYIHKGPCPGLTLEAVPLGGLSNCTIGGVFRKLRCSSGSKM